MELSRGRFDPAGVHRACEIPAPEVDRRKGRRAGGGGRGVRLDIYFAYPLVSRSITQLGGCERGKREGASIFFLTLVCQMGSGISIDRVLIADIL